MTDCVIGYQAFLCQCQPFNQNFFDYLGLYWFCLIMIC